VKVRPLQESDLPSLYQLYLEETADLPYSPKVRQAQFSDHLTTSRLFPNPAHFDPKAEIALVAERSGEPVAFASGCLLTDGDYVVGSDFGCLRIVLARPGCREEARAVIRSVIEHLESLGPSHIEALNGCLSPMFTGVAVGALPSNWGWLGQCLLDEGFEVNDRFFRMVAPLQKDTPYSDLPRGFRVERIHTRVKGAIAGLDPKYNFGVMLYEDDQEAGWCGNFFSGAFLKGGGYRQLHTHWFTIFASHQGRGLGRKLLGWCLAQAAQAGAKRAELLTSTDNFIAHEVYRSVGYRMVDTLYSFTRPCQPTENKAAQALTDGDTRSLKKLLKKHPELARARLSEGDRQPTLLHKLPEAPDDKRTQLARALLLAGADVDATDIDPRGPRALRQAVLHNDIAWARALLEGGATPEALLEPDGRGPLELALIHGYTKLARLLVKHGARPTAAQSAGLGDLPVKDLVRALSYAATNGQLKIVGKLLSQGANPNRIPDEMGEMNCTPLHRACSAGHLAVVKCLVKHGADTTITDGIYDATPGEWAQYNDQPEIAEYLKSLP
jgi:GNAT superfamily N-acetyltransferase